jgi:hypothetical protein
MIDSGQDGVERACRTLTRTAKSPEKPLSANRKLESVVRLSLVNWGRLHAEGSIRGVQRTNRTLANKRPLQLAKPPGAHALLAGAPK